MKFKENDVVFTPDKTVGCVSADCGDGFWVGYTDDGSFFEHEDDLKSFAECINEYIETITEINTHTNRCKHWNIETEKTSRLIGILYGEYNEICGGLLHILTDDNNIDDGDIQFCIQNAEEHSDNPSAPISKVIAERFMKHSMLERLCLSEFWECEKGHNYCHICELKDKLKKGKRGE